MLQSIRCIKNPLKEKISLDIQRVLANPDKLLREYCQLLQIANICQWVAITL
jgi:hypothetical protein